MPFIEAIPPGFLDFMKLYQLKINFNIVNLVDLMPGPGSRALTHGDMLQFLQFIKMQRTLAQEKKTTIIY